MFDKDSRYANHPIKTHRLADGTEVPYVARRLIPPARPVMEMAIQPGDRLDLVADRAYGDARLSWRVMDANPDPDPLTLADTPRRAPGVAPSDPSDAPSEMPETATSAVRKLKLSQIDPGG